MIIRLVLLLITIPVYATVFQKQPLDQQIREADGIVVGHYLRSKSVRLDDGKIATQMIFKMNKEFGLQSELFGMDEIIVHYPGGKIGDETLRVEGVPTFVSGENVVLMIKSGSDRYWGQNLGFGTFKVVNYGNDKMILNTIFPHDRTVGQVRYEDFEKLVKTIKGSSMKVVLTPSYQTESDNNDRKPASLEPAKNRSIASKSEEGENSRGGSGFNTLWLVLALALMGGFFRFVRQKVAK